MEDKQYKEIIKALKDIRENSKIQVIILKEILLEQRRSKSQV